MEYFFFCKKLGRFAEEDGNVWHFQVLTNFMKFIPRLSLVLFAVLILCVGCGTSVRLHDAIQDGVLVTLWDVYRRQRNPSQGHLIRISATVQCSGCIQTKKIKHPTAISHNHIVAILDPFPMHSDSDVFLQLPIR